MIKSGIPYIWNIPNTWKITRNKNLFRLGKYIVGDDFDSYQLLSLTKRGVLEKDIEQGGGKQPESFSTYQSVTKGNLVMCLFDLDCSAVFVGMSKFDGMISPAYDVFYPKENVNIQYYEYLFRYIESKRYYKDESKSLRYVLNKDQFGGLPQIHPPLKTQNRIAEYLDKEIAKINEQIDANKQTIELLGEYRASVIGEIISKRPVKKIKMRFLLKSPLKYGANASGIDYDEGLPRYIRITDIKDDNLTTEDMQSLSLNDAEDFILEDGDLLFARSGATVGKSFQYVNKLGNCAYAGYLIRAKFDNRILSDYIFNFTKSSLYKAFIDENLIQATIQNLSAEKYKNLIIPLPNEQEMKTVNNEIALVNNKVDSSIIYHKSIIEKLEEYKKSLIYEVVTGKKEV